MTRLPAPPARQSALALLTQARRALVEASTVDRPAERYSAAHLAALRAAAAILAARARPAAAGARRPSRPTSAWTLLCAVAPEMAEWAGFFAAGAAKRAAAEAGMPRAVTAREADDLLRDAETFLAVVETSLGQIVQPLLTVAGHR
ncbi:MAG: SAV_6107 family HEPN domain-containing protein [Actinomycetota bacterium]|nr:SAV_6107 family HEPN domain-containing protein [Actinomycetota bacterium]